MTFSWPIAMKKTGHAGLETEWTALALSAARTASFTLSTQALKPKDHMTAELTSTTAMASCAGKTEKARFSARILKAKNGKMAMVK